MKPFRVPAIAHGGDPQRQARIRAQRKRLRLRKKTSAARCAAVGAPGACDVGCDAGPSSTAHPAGAPAEGTAAGVVGRTGTPGIAADASAAVGAIGAAGALATGGAAFLADAFRVSPPFAELGAGSVGRVFKCVARKPVLGGGHHAITAAVKMVPKYNLRKGCQFDGSMDRCVRREIDNAVALAGHPNIVCLLSWTDSLFETHLVFPLRREDLACATSRGFFKMQAAGQLDILASVSKQLLNGLAHMHAALIIHRDLKPGNMLLAYEEEAAVGASAAAVGALNGARVVIADLGSSLQLQDPTGDDAEFDDASAANTPMGTYQYRAPETFCKEPAWDTKTDIWALGTSILFMHAMEMPFGREAMRRNDLRHVWYDIRSKLSTREQPFDDSCMKQGRREWKGFLETIPQKKPRNLPWGSERGEAFQVFLSSMLTISHSRRPLAPGVISTCSYVKHAEHGGECSSMAAR